MSAISSHPMESGSQNKRNYIKRKKCLSDATNLIRQILELIRCLRGPDYFKVDIDKMANAHANIIEAACWSPHTKMNAQEYSNLMMIKAQDVCVALIKQHLSSKELSESGKLQLKSIIQYLINAQNKKDEKGELTQKNYKNTTKDIKERREIKEIKSINENKEIISPSFEANSPFSSTPHFQRSLTPQPQIDISLLGPYEPPLLNDFIEIFPSNPINDVLDSIPLEDPTFHTSESFDSDLFPNLNV